MPFGNIKNILEDLFSSVLSLIRKFYLSGNLKCNILSIFQSLKLRIFVEKLLPISLKLSFTSNTLGCYGLNMNHLLEIRSVFPACVFGMCSQNSVIRISGLD